VNLGTARSALMDRGFDYLTQGQQDLMLNRARNDFEDYWPWPWLRSYLRGTPTPVDIPDLKYVVSVANPSDAGGELLGLEDSDVNRLDADAVAIGSGWPRYWFLVPQPAPAEGVTLNVWPSSGDVLNVIYVHLTPELLNPDDTPEIPARYHSIWIDYAVIQGYKDRDNFPAAQALQADCDIRMQRLVERYETRNRQHSRLGVMRFPSEDD